MLQNLESDTLSIESNFSDINVKRDNIVIRM